MSPLLLKELIIIFFMSDKPALDQDLYPEIHILSIMKKKHFLRSFFSKMQHKILFTSCKLGVQYLYTDIYRGYLNFLLNMAFISPSEVENIYIS